MQRFLHRSAMACLLIALFRFTASAQQIITVSAGTNFYISNGTPVSFDSLVLTPSAGYNITGANSITRAGSLTNTAPNPFVTRTYRLASPLNTYSGSIGIYYQSSELNALNASQLEINVYRTSNWSHYPSTTGSNTATASGLSAISISEVALASSLAPLPLSWLSIHARTVNNYNLISFTTTGESLCKQFTVQKSLDGRQWSDASGSIMPYNTTGPHTYQWTDTSVYAGAVFYRVRQQSVDNAVSYSMAVMVKQRGVTALTVYPNPAVDRLQITAGKNMASVCVYNSVAQIQFNNTGIMAVSHSINVLPLPKGRYTLLVTFADGSTGTQSFIKQ